MQRVASLARRIPLALGLNLSNNHTNILPAFYSTFQNIVNEGRLLMPSTPMINPICTFKVKGVVRRRCKSCYFVRRDQRMYVICPEHPRHKQMAMKPKPHNTWILTHASQSPVRPW